MPKRTKPDDVPTLESKLEKLEARQKASPKVRGKVTKLDIDVARVRGKIRHAKRRGSK